MGATGTQTSPEAQPPPWVTLGQTVVSPFHVGPMVAVPPLGAHWPVTCEPPICWQRWSLLHEPLQLGMLAQLLGMKTPLAMPLQSLLLYQQATVGDEQPSALSLQLQAAQLAGSPGPSKSTSAVASSGQTTWGDAGGERDRGEGRGGERAQVHDVMVALLGSSS